MSALAEALVAAQRRALTALSKSYVHLGDVEDAPRRDDLRAQLDLIGLTDKVEQDQLIACLDVIRAMGGETAAEPKPTGESKPSDPATDAQLALIARMVKEKNVTGPDLPITKANAHEIIDALKAGTYDPAKRYVAF